MAVAESEPACEGRLAFSRHEGHVEQGSYVLPPSKPSQPLFRGSQPGVVHAQDSRYRSTKPLERSAIGGYMPGIDQDGIGIEIFEKGFQTWHARVMIPCVLWIKPPEKSRIERCIRGWRSVG